MKLGSGLWMRRALERFVFESRQTGEVSIPRACGEGKGISLRGRRWGYIRPVHSLVFTLCSSPLLSHLTQDTSRSSSTLPGGALWSWSASLPAQCSSCFSSSSLFSLSLTITSVSITTARGWTWKIPPVRCASPKTRRSKILSMISPHQGLAQVLSSSGLVSVVDLQHCFPAG